MLEALWSGSLAEDRRGTVDVPEVTLSHEVLCEELVESLEKHQDGIIMTTAAACYWKDLVTNGDGCY